MAVALSDLISDLALASITLRQLDFERPGDGAEEATLHVAEAERSYVAEADQATATFRVVGRLRLTLQRVATDGSALPLAGHLFLTVDATYCSPRPLPSSDVLSHFAQTSGSVHLAAFQRQYVVETCARAGLPLVWMPLTAIPA